MNKKNKMLVGCLALLLVLSVGYALFSETITINGTATAKGNFDITMTCTKGIDASLNTPFSVDDEGDAIPDVDGGYENDECIVNGSSVTYGANLLYPGARRAFTIIATNTGSIPVTLDTTNGMSQTKQTCSDTNADGVVDSCSTNNNDINNFGLEMVPGFVDTNGTKIVYPDDISNFIDANGNPVLDPGEGMIIVGLIYWSAESDGDEYNGVLWKTTINSTYNFEQVKAN